MSKRSKCVVKMDSRGRWFVQLRAANGFPIYTSETFSRKSEAILKRDQFLGAARDPEYLTESGNGDEDL